PQAAEKHLREGSTKPIGVDKFERSPDLSALFRRRQSTRSTNGGTDRHAYSEYERAIAWPLIPQSNGLMRLGIRFAAARRLVRAVSIAMRQRSPSDFEG